jgi:hypothetical protein
MADTTATTHRDTKGGNAFSKAPKVLAHIKVLPAMEGGHEIVLHHNHPSHPNIQNHFPGPHAAVSLPHGHVLRHIGENMGISMSDVGAGEGTEEQTHETKELAET